MIATMAEFSAILADIQARRAAEVRCMFTPHLSAKVNDAALVEALVTGLPMAQGVQHHIIRSRGRGAVLTAKVRYRDAVRMLGGDALTKEEAAALEMARGIAADFLSLNEEARFNSVYDWVCRNVRYVHTAPGRKGYEGLVGVSGVVAVPGVEGVEGVYGTVPPVPPQDASIERTVTITSNSASNLVFIMSPLCFYGARVRTCFFGAG